MKKPFYWAMGFTFSLLCLSSSGEARRARDPRIDQVADLIEAKDTGPLFQNVSASEWTQDVLVHLPDTERRHLAKALRHAKNSIIRLGHIEQYRVVWRSSALPDSEFVLSFLMDAHPGELSKPLIAFSSNVDKLPGLLAEALDDNHLTFALSFYESGSPWRLSLPKMSQSERKNLARWYHSVKLQVSQEESRHYKGEYVDKGGVLRQNELTVRLNSEGRWEAE
jgi:hypothetical protein